LNPQQPIDLPTLKVLHEDVTVEYDFTLLPASAPFSAEIDGAPQSQIQEGLHRVKQALQETQSKVDTLNIEIDRLTNHADRIDNMVAVGSGLIAGVIDSLWVGTFDFKNAKAWSNHQVNDFVMRAAKSKGYDGNRLEGAISFLENEYKVPTDNIWKGKNLGISAKSHHLDDLSHHPTPIGLFFSILTQFTKKGYFQNGEGNFLPIDVDENGLELIGTDIPSKFFCGTVNWFFHLVSDMSGSSKTAGVGMGIPGPIVSILKEISAIPGLDRTGLPQKLKEVFTEHRFDLRSELAVLHELGRQAVPVIINEVLVRAFFFIRRLVNEIKTKRSFKNIDWLATLPWNNRTLTRMLTIATGTFTAVDMADATIRSALKSGGNLAAFGSQLILRVNFVGIGRFAIAIYSDVSMGKQRSVLREDRIQLMSQQLHWHQAKISYLQSDVWYTAGQTEASLQTAECMMRQSFEIQAKALQANKASMENISAMQAKLRKKNPKLIDDIQDILKW
jgi:hypothetical protein